MVKGSPKIKSNKKLDMFLYLLMRDSSIPLGEIERIVIEIEKIQSENTIFSNGFLAEYAQNLRKRLSGDLKIQKIKK